MLKLRKNQDCKDFRKERKLYNKNLNKSNNNIKITSIIYLNHKIPMPILKLFNKYKKIKINFNNKMH
jgi:hypothetical protein